MELRSIGHPNLCSHQVAVMDGGTSVALIIGLKHFKFAARLRSCIHTYLAFTARPRKESK